LTRAALASARDALAPRHCANHSIVRTIEIDGLCAGKRSHPWVGIDLNVLRNVEVRVGPP